MDVESRRHARRLLRRAAAAHSLGKAKDGYWSILSMIGVWPKCDRRRGSWTWYVRCLSDGEGEIRYSKSRWLRSKELPRVKR